MPQDGESSRRSYISNTPLVAQRVRDNAAIVQMSESYEKNHGKKKGYRIFNDILYLLNMKVVAVQKQKNF